MAIYTNYPTLCLRSPDKHRIRADSVADIGPASLGMPCLTDSQCHLVDPYTRCVNKRCDCAYRTNSTSACSARNRGCLPGTFQVKDAAHRSEYRGPRFDSWSVVNFSWLCFESKLLRLLCPSLRCPSKIASSYKSRKYIVDNGTQPFTLKSDKCIPSS